MSQPTTINVRKRLEALMARRIITKKIDNYTVSEPHTVAGHWRKYIAY
jgi:hypothetical protein